MLPLTQSVQWSVIRFTCVPNGSCILPDLLPMKEAEEHALAVSFAFLLSIDQSRNLVPTELDMRGSTWQVFLLYALAVVRVCLLNQSGGRMMTVVEARAEQATCAAAPNTLSFECDNKCDESIPCWLNTTASTTNCTYHCFTEVYVDATDFMFLIPFGEWTRAHMTTPVTTTELAPTGDTGNYSSANNDVLESIATMKLRNSTETVYDNSSAMRSSDC